MAEFESRRLVNSMFEVVKTLERLTYSS